MKILESVKIIQFYLFEQVEFRLGEITGLFGPNASGKSSLLDAIQTAMFGGHVRWSALNAQAEDHATARTLRAYCLGQVGQGDENRARDNALTYITLVWRDTETQEPVSMGVCISASVDRDTHEVQGRYLLRGVELAMTDHLEVVDGEERPRSWSTFRLMLKQRAMPGETDVDFPDSERYLQAYLFALRAERVPPKDAFRKAFRFALRMRFDKSLDAIVRDDVLEARPTNIKKFKDVTESFRQLKDQVDRLQKKLDAGRDVQTLYDKVIEESRRRAAWNALEKEASVGLCTERLDAATAALARADEEHTAATREHSRLNDEIKAARAAAESARARKEAHAFHKNVGALESSAREQEEKVRGAEHEVRLLLSLVERTLRHPLVHTLVSERVAQLEEAATCAEGLQRDWTTLPTEVFETQLRVVLDVAAAAAGDVGQHHGKTVHAKEKLNDELGLARAALERVGRGQALLQRSTVELRTSLADVGVNATPVCDLVSLKDLAWQPVIEAFLQRNAEALLVDVKDEREAFRVFRRLDAIRPVYGAKLVLPSKQDVDATPAKGSVAELISGKNPYAVAFVRRQFGRLRCTDGDDETLAEAQALTRDGMLLRGGAAERLELYTPSRFRIGGSSAEQRALVAASVRELEAKLKTSEAAAENASKLLLALQQVASVDLIVGRVLEKRHVRDVNSAAIEVTRALLEQQADEGYRMLVEQERQQNSLAARLEERVTPAATRMGRAESELSNARGAIAPAEDQLRIAQGNDQQARSESVAAGVNAELMERLRDTALAATGGVFAPLVGYCRKQSSLADSRHGEKWRDAFRDLNAFCLAHGEVLPPTASKDWALQAAWLEEVLARIHDTQLLPYKQDMDDAFARSQETFRQDVAAVLAENLEWLDETINRLNRVLRECPTFSNGERYRFKRTVRANLDPLLQFVRRVADIGPTQDLLGGPGEVPEEFRRLLEERSVPGAAGLPSPLEDFRQFFDFDVEILREDQTTGEARFVGLLSKRIGPGSGGEHRAPLYVIAGAALASAYRLAKDQPAGMRLIMLDEAFNKMDMGNIIATMRYFEELGLQVLLASPGENLGILNSFLHRYYTIDRDPINNTVTLDARELTVAARDSNRADLWEFHPELVEAEVRAASQPA